MAGQATVQSGLTVTDGTNVIFRGATNVHTETVVTPRPPTPGLVRIPTAGRDLEFDELTNPGLVKFTNMDDTNYVEIGVREPATGTFYPLFELPPKDATGEYRSYTMRFSRNLREQYAGSGTGTTSQENKLRLKANNAPCFVNVEAIEA